MDSGVQSLSAADFPGYAAAVDRENLVRARACLGGLETLCGVPVKPLTARHVRWLTFADSPFMMNQADPELLFGHPEIHLHFKLFLWIVSKEFKPGPCRRDMGARRCGCRRCRFFVRHPEIDKLSVKDAVESVIQYIDDAYLDAGPLPDEAKAYYAFEIPIVAAMHKSYGLPVDFWETGWLRNFVRRITGKPSPLDVPLKIFWQLQKVEKRMNNPEAILSNASCKCLSDGLSEINRRARADNEYFRELATAPAKETNWKPDGNKPPGWEYQLN